MLQGKEVTFKSNKTETWKIIDNQVKYLRDNKVQSTSISTFQDFSRYEKVLNWYNHIPEGGILCWLWNIDYKYRDISIIKGYSFENSLFIEKWDNENIYWKNAEPLTKEELQVFLNNAL